MGHFRDVSKAVSAASATSCNLTLSSGLILQLQAGCGHVFPVWGVLIMLRAISIRAASALALLEGIVYFYLNAWESCGEHHALVVGVLRALTLSSEATSAFSVTWTQLFCWRAELSEDISNTFLKKERKTGLCKSTCLKLYLQNKSWVYPLAVL